MTWLPNPMFEIIQSYLHSREYPYRARMREAYLRDYVEAVLDGRFGTQVGTESHDKLTVILLSYRRVRNISPILRTVCSLSFVEKIIISNNNPDVRIREWLPVVDERVQIVDQGHPTSAGVRYELAWNEPGAYFLSIDDDVFLTRWQMKALFEHLRRRPRSPHGVHGELFLENIARRGTPNALPHEVWSVGSVYLDDHEATGALDGDGLSPELVRSAVAGNVPGWLDGLMGLETSVDVLNRVYGFTRNHAQEYRRLAEALRLDVRALYNDDVVLAFCGESKPLCHDLGRIRECLSSHRQSIATWRKPHFRRDRSELFRRLDETKPLHWPIE